MNYLFESQPGLGSGSGSRTFEPNFIPGTASAQAAIHALNFLSDDDEALFNQYLIQQQQSISLTPQSINSYRSIQRSLLPQQQQQQQQQSSSINPQSPLSNSYNGGVGTVFPDSILQRQAQYMQAANINNNTAAGVITKSELITTGFNGITSTSTATAATAVNPTLSYNNPIPAFNLIHNQIKSESNNNNSHPAINTANPTISNKKRKNIPTRKKACVSCNVAKTVCNGLRPCDRCTRLNKSESCIDRPSRLNNKKQNLLQPQSQSQSQSQPQRSNPIRKNSKSGINDPTTAVTVTGTGIGTVTGDTDSVDSIDDNHSDDAAAADGDCDDLLSNPNQSSTSNSGSSSEQQHRTINNNNNNNPIDTIPDSIDNDDEAERRLSNFILNTHKAALTKSMLEKSSRHRNNCGLTNYFSYLYETLHNEDYTIFMKFLGYKQQQQQQQQNQSQSQDQIITDTNWQPPSNNLPIIPNKFQISWNLSPLNCIEDLPLTNFATLVVAQPRWLKYIQKQLNPNSIISDPNTPKLNSPILADNNIQSTETETDSSNTDSNYTNGNPKVELIVQVNRQFERLFGYTQSDIRQMFNHSGRSSLHKLIAPQSLEDYHKVDLKKMFSGDTEFSSSLTVQNKWELQFPALLHRKFIPDDNGTFLAAYSTWIKLPETESNNTGTATAPVPAPTASNTKSKSLHQHQHK